MNGSVELLAPASNVEDLRAERVWRLARVAWLTWAFFTLYCWFRDYRVAAWICLAETMLVAAIIRFHRGSANYRRVMNLVLGACATGLPFVSISDSSLHRTMLYFPAAILIASQLLGVRAALQWLLFSFVGNLAFTVMAHGLPALLSGRSLDEFTLVFGVSVCVFLCCQQGEQFYLERTKGLVELSERLREKGRRLQFLATTDSLTGLLNRFQFQQELRTAVRHASGQGERMALVLVDMDGFKDINDTMGHPVGDKALIEVARRLQGEFDREAMVARLGGDEFCLIFSAVGSQEEATHLARRVRSALTGRYILDSCDFALSASVGLALCPDHTQCDTDLLAFADTAMFFAKERHLGYALYARDMTERLVEYRTMQEQLAGALEREEFYLVYQPQVSLATGHVAGVEALLRWRHDGQIISPSYFIPLLEKSREIIPVSRWLLRECSRQLRVWNDAGHDIKVSINVSSLQFKDPEFLNSITGPLREFGISARQLDFEVTESLLVDDIHEAAQRLTELKEIGATISIDDFGTGYSSMAYLKQLPLDRLKIDRAFIKDFPQADDGVIAKSITALAKSIGLTVLAEGVETDAQVSFLKALDCDEYQGFFFSRPVSAGEVGPMLTLRAHAEHQAFPTITYAAPSGTNATAAS